MSDISYAYPTNWSRTPLSFEFVTNVTNQIVEFVCSLGENLKSLNLQVSLTSLEVDQETVTVVAVAPYEIGEYLVSGGFNVSIECLCDDEYVATFDEGEVSCSGDSLGSAVEQLKFEVIEVYKLFQANMNKLGPRPTRQLAVLERYIGKKTR